MPISEFDRDGCPQANFLGNPVPWIAGSDENSREARNAVAGQRHDDAMFNQLCELDAVRPFRDVVIQCRVACV